MPIIPQPIISQDLRQEIERAEDMYASIISNTPDVFVSDNDEKMLVGIFYSLAREHFTAILYLLRAGQFDGSAFALARPLVEAAYKAHWLYCCAKPATVARIKAGGNCFPPFSDIAELIEKKMDAEGIFTFIAPLIKSLHGFTHGGMEQMARRINEHGDIRPNYDDNEKLELIDMITRVLTTLAIAWPQLISHEHEHLSHNISAKYLGLYPNVVSDQ
jgi:hypothetical protein